MIGAPDLGPNGSAEGSAFPLAVKLLSSLMVALVVAGALRSADALLAAPWSGTALALMGGALALLLLGVWWIWHSRTRVDAGHIRQSWIWSKQVAWSDVVQARVIAVPYLEWLIAPRLIVRARGGLVMVFHVADPSVLRTLAVRMATRATPSA